MSASSKRLRENISPPGQEVTLAAIYNLQLELQSMVTDLSTKLSNLEKTTEARLTHVERLTTRIVQLENENLFLTNRLHRLETAANRLKVRFSGPPSSASDILDFKKKIRHFFPGHGWLLVIGDHGYLRVYF